MEEEIRREESKPEEEKEVKAEEKPKEEEPKKEAKAEEKPKEDEKTEKEAKEEQSGIVERKPWTKWTKHERMDQLKKRRHGMRERWFVLLLFMILLIVFLAGTIYSITYQMDPALIIIMIALLVTVMIVGVFFIQHVWFATE